MLFIGRLEGDTFDVCIKYFQAISIKDDKTILQRVNTPTKY